MGAIAGTLADVAVVTSDNPRTEEPEAIIGDILAGMEDTPARQCVEPDRRKAIPPVSYTHLDVYKRQAYDGSAVRQLPGEEVLQPRPMVRPKELSLIHICWRTRCP